MTSSRGPNLVFLFSDQHAQRIAGCYGDPVAETPNLDRLAAAGVTFDNVYCASPLCVPSRMALLAGRYPNELDCRTNHETLHTDVPTFAHGLAVAGYAPVLVGRMHALGPDQTHGFAQRRVGDIGATWAGGPQPDLGAIGLARGSSGPAFHWSGAGRTSYLRFDQDVTAGALAYLDEVAARRGAGDQTPFFLSAGWFLPHHPYIAEPEDYAAFEGGVAPPHLSPAEPEHPFIRSWREQTKVTDLPDEVVARARTAYYANVRLIDRMIGQIVERLEALGLADDTLIIYASDHGEQLGERGVWCKSTMYDQSAKVPLVMAWPGRLPSNQRRDHVVNLIDLNATFLDAAGAEPLPGSRSRSLLPIARDPNSPWKNETFSEYYAGLISVDTRPQQHRMVRSDRWKLVYYHGMPIQLFDLVDDPDERHDLADSPEHAEVREALMERVLDGWDPDAIGRRMAEKEPATRLRRQWAAAAQPEEPFRYQHLHPEDNWLLNAPAERWKRKHHAMPDRPHIILIMTDQQRFDTISALGAPWMITPNLDRLAKEGTSFNNCFVTSPVCVAARASLFTGQYPHASGVFGNFHQWEPTWVRSLADAGYHCASIGKMHINPHDAPGGFHQRYWVENKDRPLFLEEHDRALYDEWDRALHVRGLEKPSRYNRFARDPEGFRRALGAFEWELPEAMHPDVFVGDTALWWLEDRKAETPLFLQIGFPGPHPPYDPTARHLELYRDADIPVPDVSEAEIAAQPRGQAELRRNMIERNMDAIVWKERPPAEELLRLRRYYAANVTMIDEKVGQILEVLERRGYLDNALVIFTSDHGDALGDHGHIQKWTMYDTVVRVPLLLWAPGRVDAGQKVDDLVQLMDIAPTVLDAAGVPVPDTFEARSLTPYLRGRPETPVRDVVHAELARDHIQTGSEYILMRRDQRYKLVWYLGEDEGELYDLETDPGEVRNLWHDPAQRARRDAMVDAAKDWSIRGLLETRRPPAAAAPRLPTLNR